MDAILQVRRVTIAAVMPVLAVVGCALAHADPPSPGDPCTQWHATTQDSSGQTMWCNRTMTGDHSLVWQYGGPSDQ